MALRVEVLRFDGVTPSPDHIEEFFFQLRGATVHVGELAARAELLEESMRLVESVQRIAVPAAAPEHLAQLACGLALEDEGLALHGVLLGTEVVLCSFCDVALQRP